jgi:osmoprotectant transport system substrate-binding protein
MTNHLSRRSLLGGVGALGLSIALDGCGMRGGLTIAVGSKEFTEELLLGEMYAQLLEHGGFRVRRHLGLGGTQVAMSALQHGAIDLYPEYTGTALLNQLKLPLIKDDKILYDTVARAYKAQYQLIWLDQAPMNDSQAIAVTREFSNTHRLKTMSDLSTIASTLRLGAVPEFVHRTDGLPGLQQTYGGFHFAQVRILDSGLKYRALLAKDVDAVVAFGTDGAIISDHLLVLEDDKRFWPTYHVAPVVRESTLQKHPLIAKLLNPLAPTLSSEVMSRLNEQVDGEKREVADVASEYLQKIGLVRG